MSTLINSTIGNQIVSYITKGTTIAPAGRFVALYSNVFAGTEVVGGDYARVDATTVFGTASAGAISNTSAVDFATSAPAVTIDGVGIWDLVSGGTEVARWNLTTPRTVTLGDIIRMPIGSLLFGEVGG